MHLQVIKALLAGVFFGLWPLFLNRSGLSGSVSPFLLTCLTLVFVTPMAVYNWDVNAGANWLMLLSAGITASMGLIAFNSMLSKEKPENVGMFVVIMTLMQISIPTLYTSYMVGGLSMTKLFGFLLAILAGVLIVS